jgi:nucleotide-binding universal stress UspA family protein
MMQGDSFHVLVPATPAPAAAELIGAADDLARQYGGTGTLLGVVEIPVDRSLSEGALEVRRKRHALTTRLAHAEGQHELTVAVRTAHSLAEGIRASVAQVGASLLLLDWRPKARTGCADLANLVDDPPCDLALYRRGRTEGIRNVLLPVRGGPHAELALRVAQAIAKEHAAVLTLLHITVPLWSASRKAREEEYFQAVRRQVSYQRCEQLQVESDSIESVLLAQGSRHDLIVMGAAARDDAALSLVGRIPMAVARKVTSGLIVVKTREPVTRHTFAATAAEEEDIAQVVDRWFAENSFHSREFRNIGQLVDLKERQGRTISLAVPTLNEEKTVGKIVSTIRRELVDRFPLVDELVVIDSGSHDRTIEIVEGLGVKVFQHANILPEYGSYRGKGEALWKSLYVTSGDILGWVDSDITGFTAKFVYGLFGPLLTQPHLGFVKGFYRRPLNLGGERLATGGGRVTELTARPLFNLFFPRLSGLVQPLAGEMAGRRDVLESVPFFTGYGVETGLLIDILESFGLPAIAQSDLEERVHRNQTLFSLSKMAFAIVQVVVRRLGDRQRLHLVEEMNTSMKLIHYSPTQLFLEVNEIEEHERPPIKSLPEYADRGGRSGHRLVSAGGTRGAQSE